MPRIDLTLGDRTCPIIVEPGLCSRLGQVSRSFAETSQVLLLMDRNVASPHGNAAMQSLRAAGFAVTAHDLIAEESQKSLDVVRSIYSAMAAMKFERAGTVLAMGGGLVGDVAGFSAATWHRGVNLVHAPTTLLAMVDASIGGKTGVNLQLPDGSLGKNLVGAFHQPLAVLSDPHVLRTLSPRDFRCGLAECIKHALIADAQLLDWMETRLPAIVAADDATLVELITRCAAIKCAIVQEDERETGRRALLNLGHTFAHAVEPIAELDLHHGEAVAVGIVAAMHVSVRTQRMSPEQASRVRVTLERAGLPMRMHAPIPVARLMSAMALDKKVHEGKLRLILPRGIGAAEVVNDVPAAAIEDAWRSVGAQ